MPPRRGAALARAGRGARAPAVRRGSHGGRGWRVAAGGVSPARPEGVPCTCRRCPGGRPPSTLPRVDGGGGAASAGRVDPRGWRAPPPPVPASRRRGGREAPPAWPRAPPVAGVAAPPGGGHAPPPQGRARRGGPNGPDPAARARARPPRVTAECPPGARP
ncbi:hypothetical protein BU14_0070s0005 [Porphyra umbilicalis]|uniref:Uncharacterized protein n=1 Tax=Porphyra umbilicalis TaxID=2786 RepID=A0A1X6PG58_PORUM|nr:hypothetical protein BU14_0070s0005 [Porphyra umbilicalis]|eukprot:OSX79830.1 hypothetical protein BU14_0070s0005 [Porphyra umbilicalis]